MTKPSDSEQRIELLKKIQNYDQLISGYHFNDIPKSATELEDMSIPELEKWLKTRTTYYQFQVDQDIENEQHGCGN